MTRLYFTLDLLYKYLWVYLTLLDCTLDSTHWRDLTAAVGHLQHPAGLPRCSCFHFGLAAARLSDRN